MARIACFSDSPATVRAAHLGLSGREHAIFPLPSSRLTDDLRRTVCQLAPHIILLELSHSLDNPHLFIFLRSDAVTRDVPIIVLSPSEQLELYATALGADGFLRSPFSALELAGAVARHIAPEGIILPEPTIEVPPRRTPVPAAARARSSSRSTSIPALVPALALA